MTTNARLDEAQRTAAADDPLIGTVLASRYRVEKRLGAGGMGTVYLAQHIKLQKPMAVKVLHKEMSTVTEVVARFEREAIAAARIDHPNVVAATDFGTLEDGCFFLVLEYIAGRSLRSALVPGAMSAHRALHIARQIADALSAAHDAGIVHRDLKPENVMLVDRRGRSDVVKVLDFGIAKVTWEDARGAPQLTRLGAVFGTPEYMAPEQAAGLSVDARADLYALGILLFEMLDGRAPFEGSDPVAVVQRQIRDAPPPLPPKTPPDVVALVTRLLAKKADERVQTAAEVVRRIDEILPRIDAPDADPVTSVGDATIAVDAPTSLALPVVSQTDLDRGLPTVLGARAPDAEPIDVALKRTVLVGTMRVPLWLTGLAAMGAVVAVLLGVVLLVSLLGDSAPRVR